MPISDKRYPFYIILATLTAGVVVVLTALLLWISHRESKPAAIQMADRLFSEINQKTLERYESALQSVAVLAGMAARMPAMASPPETDGRAHPGLDLMIDALAFSDYLFSLYTGYDDGRFLQVIAIRNRDDLLSRFLAPESSTFALRSIVPDAQGRRRQHWVFFDQDRKIIGRREESDAAYDPRDRPWYTVAQEENTAFFTKPYVFSSTGTFGITCARKLVRGGGVFGADITLDRFAQSLEKQKVSGNGLLFLFDRAGRIIASSKEESEKTGRAEELRLPSGAESSDPVIRAVVAGSLAEGDAGMNRTLEMQIRGTAYLVRSSPIKEALRFDQILASAAPVSDFTGHITQMMQRISLFSAVVMVAALPLALLMSRKISASLVRLEQESAKIQRFDFSQSVPFDSGVREIHSLIQSFGLMKTTIRDRTDALIATQKKLQTLVQSGIALAAEADMDHLLRKIFESARVLSHADGGTLYLRDSDNQLRFEIMQQADGGTVRAEEKDVRGLFAPIPIEESAAGPDSPRRVERQVALTGQTVVINKPDDAALFDLSASCRLEAAAGTVCRNFLTAPLRTREGKVIGILQVFNARNEKTGEVDDFNTEVVGFVEALAAQAAVALHNKRLLEEQRALFDAFIQLIAGAIDAKSPYTGGHCARVPEVAAMLARAAHDIKEGPFAGYRVETEDQWREFSIAAWLHDCGKVTTPEYVVDKSVKLETIYNRIHEIRTRFEVLLRDADIDYYRKLLAGGCDEKTLKAELEKTRKQIMEDFAFVAGCNIGGEFMADEKIARLKQIASRTWLRHLDDRIGISDEEAALKRRVPDQELPVREHVLADKPEHVIPRNVPDPLEGDSYGFRMTVPKDQYNLGELYNLSIRKGTLSPEDRFKINEHIIQTIKMLTKLPVPEYLENVAEFAGAHHETMIGTGYPRRLKKDEMSVPARIIAIADIFEALTAVDRPYKKPKTLNEALRIMSFMRNEQHIDADLFDLFLRSGVFRIYAEQFMDPGQIDEVNIDDYLSDGR